MAMTTLRSLAKAYAKKNLETPAYREARAKFINGVLTGEVELSVNEYPPLIRPKRDEAAEVTVRRESKKKTTPLTEHSPPHPEPDAGSRNLLIPAIVAVVLLVIGITVFLLASGGDTDEVPAGVDAQVQPTTPDKPNEAQLLVRDLLNQRNWTTQANLDTFMGKWLALPADTRAASMNTLELNQLTTAIYKQLLKERALSGIGNETEAKDKQRKLIDFANKIGIDDPRIKMTE